MSHKVGDAPRTAPTLAASVIYPHHRRMKFLSRFWKKRPAPASRTPLRQPGVCGICARPLNVALDPMSGDCGGDCWGCIGDIETEGGGDPELNLSIPIVAEEIALGWREADGTPKPQSFFLAGNPSFIKQVWPTDDRDDIAPSWPIEVWSELDADRREVRNITIRADGRVTCSTRDDNPGGHMGKKQFPSLSEINAALPYDVQAVSREAFERAWQAKGPTARA